MANTPPPSSGRSLGATLWPLLTGLAFGYIIGNKTAGIGHSGESAEVEKAADKGDKGVPAGTKLPEKIYKSEAEFPAGWTKLADLANVKSVSFDGLSAPQKVTV